MSQAADENVRKWEQLGIYVGTYMCVNQPSSLRPYMRMQLPKMQRGISSVSFFWVWTLWVSQQAHLTGMAARLCSAIWSDSVPERRIFQPCLYPGYLCKRRWMDFKHEVGNWNQGSLTLLEHPWIRLAISSEFLLFAKSGLSCLIWIHDALL